MKNVVKVKEGAVMMQVPFLRHNIYHTYLIHILIKEFEIIFNHYGAPNYLKFSIQIY